MWIFHNVTREYAGQLVGDIPVDHDATDVQPPVSQPGVRLLFGYYGEWEPHGIPSITRAKGRLALHRAGLLQAAEAIIAQADVETRIWYEEQVWERSDPVVVQMGAALGLTPEQIDAMFMAA